MEDKIEVGEYVRTKRGIKKVCYINDNKTVNKYSCKGRNDLEEDEFEVVKTTEILKHSKNLIDLIELYDYVNSFVVFDIMTNCDGEKIIILTSGTSIKNNQIEDVVTHEQFDQMKYIVEE